MQANRKINLETVFKIVILLGYSLVFIVLILTGRVRAYLHPRLVPYMIFAAVFFLLMVYSLLQDLKRKSRRFSVVPYIIFALPLILAFAVPPKAVNSAAPQFSGPGIAGSISGKSTVTENPIIEATAPADNGGSPDAGDNQEPAPASGNPDLQPNQKAVYSKTPFGSTVVLIITDDTITLDDGNFVSWMSELDNNPDEYKGMKIGYVGYVYKSSDFENDQFVAGRDMMWCCAADIELIGCLCRFDKAAGLDVGSWVRIDGTLDTATWRGDAIPLVVDTTVTPAGEPVDLYVYPAY